MHTIMDKFEMFLRIHSIFPKLFLSAVKLKNSRKFHAGHAHPVMHTLPLPLHNFCNLHFWTAYTCHPHSCTFLIHFCHICHSFACVLYKAEKYEVIINRNNIVPLSWTWGAHMRVNSVIKKNNVYVGQNSHLKKISDQA